MTIRPKSFAYYVIYFFAALMSILSTWLMYQHFSGNTTLTIFDFICCFIVPLIFIVFSFHFGKVKIKINNNEIVITQSIWKNRAENDKRNIADFLFSQNGKIQKIVVDTIVSTEIKQYGFTKDFGMDYIGESPMLKKDFYLSQEIIFIMEDGDIKSLNARPYTKKSIRKLRNHITQSTGVEPMGSLKSI